MDARVAYFSMEIGIDPRIPTYAGGLGILAGDVVRTAADMGIPLVGVTLLYRNGYFSQGLDASGWQLESPTGWNFRDLLTPLPDRVSIRLEGREVSIASWSLSVVGNGPQGARILFLDTCVEENDPRDKEITNSLYSGDLRHRLRQEAILGVGGVRMLRKLGYSALEKFHMNEGHAALLSLELLKEGAFAHCLPVDDPLLREAVRKRCVFTTHTPVEAGHDRFSMTLVEEVLESELLAPLRAPRYQREACPHEQLNMTLLGCALSGYVNGVAKRHAEVSARMFPQIKVDGITNGVHAGSWVAPALRELFDQKLPGWGQDNSKLGSAEVVEPQQVRAAHEVAKRSLIEEVNKFSAADFKVDAFTICFARRATAYKRPLLALSNPERLASIARTFGPVQLLFAGKAHPADHRGKELIQQVIRQLKQLPSGVCGVYLPNYEMALAKLMVSGADLWLNTPLPPHEASGTSGMKAALNGVPSLSSLDGWWLEGHIEGVTGWSIGGFGTALEAHMVNGNTESEEQFRRDSEAFYSALEKITELFYRHPEKYVEVMRSAIARNGSEFNTQRMLREYAQRAWCL